MTLVIRLSVTVHLLSSFAKNNNSDTRCCNEDFVNKERSQIDDKEDLSKKSNQKTFYGHMVLFVLLLVVY